MKKNCEAKLITDDGNKHMVGEPCRWEAHKEVDGATLCFTHAAAVENGVRALDDVLAGR